MKLSTAFTVSHRFWVVLFSFSFISMHILIYFVVCWLFRGLLYSLHIFVFLIAFFSCSVQFNLSIMSDSLQPHEPQHTTAPCPSPTPRVHCVHDAIQPSHPLSSQMSQLSASGGQSIGVSASTSVLPMNTQDRSPLGWTGWISFQSKGLSRVFSNTTVQKHQFFSAQLFSQSNIHIHT